MGLKSETGFSTIDYNAKRPKTPEILVVLRVPTFAGERLPPFFLQACLSQHAFQGLGVNVVARMAGNRDGARLDRVDELAMAAPGSVDFPAVLLEQF